MSPSLSLALRFLPLVVATLSVGCHSAGESADTQENAISTPPASFPWLGAYEQDPLDGLPIRENTLVFRVNGAEDPTRSLLLDVTQYGTTRTGFVVEIGPAVIEDGVMPHYLAEGRLPDGSCTVKLTAVWPFELIHAVGTCETAPSPESFGGFFQKL
jgi:hypothetical protein